VTTQQTNTSNRGRVRTAEGDQQETQQQQGKGRWPNGLRYELSLGKGKKLLEGFCSTWKGDREA
jgi:hypothetical protein